MTNSADGIKLFASSLGQYHATIDLTGSIKVFAPKEAVFEQVREYAHISTAVVAVQFAPPQYHPYMLVVSVDRRLSLFNIEDKALRPIFQHFEEGSEEECFTTGDFIDGPAETLKFVVGTSSGFALLFSSENKFAVQRIELGPAAIKTLAVGQGEALAVVCEGEPPRLYSHGLHVDYVEFGKEEHAGRNVCQLAFPRGLRPAGDMLLSADENGRVVLWQWGDKEGSLRPIAAFETETEPAALCWDHSGLSALIMGVGKATHESCCWRLTRDFDEVDEAAAWSIAEASLTDDH